MSGMTITLAINFLVGILLGVASYRFIKFVIFSRTAATRSGAPADTRPDTSNPSEDESRA
jgi:hypothetical protein